MKLTLQCVQSQATLLGLTIVEDHNYTYTGEIADGGQGYWIEDPDLGDLDSDGVTPCHVK